MPGFAQLPLRVALVAGLLLVPARAARSPRSGSESTARSIPRPPGASPGATARQLVIGQDVIFNEHIATAANGQTQLLFLDESAMTIGPNSDLTIDQFVYDPKTRHRQAGDERDARPLALCRRQAEQAGPEP